MTCLKDMTNRGVAGLKTVYYIQKGLNFASGTKATTVIELKSDDWFQEFWIEQCLSREQSKLFTTREEAEKHLEKGNG
jgi:hypothetical protein